MLERVALHQTRLRTPGLSLDSRGIALGSHGLLLFPSLDRLVAFFAVYTQHQPLDDWMNKLRVELLRSNLGGREVALIVQIDASERMDSMAEVAALAGGFTFTGGGRFWVQYRDAAAPYGYDLSEVSQTQATYQLHHTTFNQGYHVERTIDLKALFLRLSPRRDPTAGTEAGPRWILAEQGLGGALLHYLRRSDVQARVGICEWPPLSALEDTPVRRYLFDLPAYPPRMNRLFTSTPGLRVFVPVAPGAAVEVGYRHPIQLRAIPSFRGPGLVLFLGRGEAPLELPQLPILGTLDALVRMEVFQGDPPPPAVPAGEPSPLRIPLRLLPSLRAPTDVSAAWIEPAQLPLLRKLLYLLGSDTLRKATLALSDQGAFLRTSRGTQLLPLGHYYRALAPNLYVPAGYETAPAVSPQVLLSAIDVPDGSVVILRHHGAPWVIPESCFVSLETAILEGTTWAPLHATVLNELASPLPRIQLQIEDPGLRPLRDVEIEGP
ncbi:MAG: hypothetical protein RMJ98_18525 [Myxococcales bacterium]|nr:hypothetical protein [Polyangiaceae bacterium]MDW8251295.1 hypothetical protein [Myxococcales bacterium]